MHGRAISTSPLRRVHQEFELMTSLRHRPRPKLAQVLHALCVGVGISLLGMTDRQSDGAGRASLVCLPLRVADRRSGREGACWGDGSIALVAVVLTTRRFPTQRNRASDGRAKRGFRGWRLARPYAPPARPLPTRTPRAFTALREVFAAGVWHGRTPRTPRAFTANSGEFPIARRLMRAAKTEDHDPFSVRTEWMEGAQRYASLGWTMGVGGLVR